MHEYETIKEFSEFLFTIDTPIQEPLDILLEELDSSEDNNYLFSKPPNLENNSGESQSINPIDISTTENNATEFAGTDIEFTSEREAIREFNQFSFTTDIPLGVPLRIEQEEPGPNIGIGSVDRSPTPTARLATTTFQNLTVDIGRGFGDPDNRYAWSVIENDGYLFVGTLNLSNGGEVWRTSLNGTDWTKVLDFDAEVQGIREIVNYQDLLYAFTTGEAGTEPSGFVSSDNGDTWTEIFGGPLDSTVNESIRTSIIYNGLLYVGTFDTSGAEVWTFDGTNWNLVQKFSEEVEKVSTFVEFEGELYTGVWDNDGDLFYTGENFDVNVTPAFGGQRFESNNGGVMDTMVFQDQLYLSTWNFVNGFSVFRTSDPLNGQWEIVTQNGFGDRDNSYGWNFEVYDDPLTPEDGDVLYLGTANSGFYDRNRVPFDATTPKALVRENM